MILRVSAILWDNFLNLSYIVYSAMLICIQILSNSGKYLDFCLAHYYCANLN